MSPNPITDPLSARLGCQEPERHEMSLPSSAGAEARERPVIFSGPMVRAILEGRKTQTRRIVRADCQGYQKLRLDERGLLRQGGMQEQAWTKTGRWVRCPYGKAGDLLWVREGWRWYGRERGGETEGGLEYRADGSHRRFTDFADPDARWRDFLAASLQSAVTLNPYRWRPAIHMPRWASRLTLELLSVRVERLQDISEEDALAEAPIFTEDASAKISDSIPVCMFAYLWDRINDSAGKRWADNPWVWIIEFRRREATA